MRYVYLNLLIVIFVVACQETPEKQAGPQQTNTPQATETAPTNPEATEIYEPVPPRVIPGENGAPPSDAIILFDGKNLDKWVSAKDSVSPAPWKVNPDGSFTVVRRSGDIQTKDHFGSVQLHIEWKSPEVIENEGQHRGNSGVFLQNRYEVQVLDNNDNPTYTNGQVGSVYKQSVPLAMASVPTGKWNTYDIIYHAPVFNDAGEKTKSATVTVIHNGVLVQDHFEIEGTTEYIGWPKNIAHGDSFIKLQDHDADVSYRNIWVRKLE
ncbi:MAG: DUF1080 domain-containing protein [Flavobacteriaceae bacterium]|nr:DUF1080 domain-containing protein [Flavobacteriaceae bacterium]